MPFLEAGVRVLEDFGVPLDAREITRRALESGLITSDGKTPVLTMAARIAVDIQRRGTQSVLQRTGPGMFALRRWGLPEHLVDRGSPTAGGRTRRGRAHGRDR